MAIKKYHVSKNLFDYSNYFDSTFVAYGQYFEYATITLSPNTTYTASTSYEKNVNEMSFMIVNSSTTPTTASYGLSNETPITITTNDDGIVRLYKRTQSTSQTKIPTKNDFVNSQEWLMLNTGSTAEPYEPYDPEVWHTIPYRKYGTETDTNTTLPAEIIADGQSATVGLVGNMVQSGTPTPQNPIQPQETGERTGNLLNPTLIMINKAFNTAGVLVDYEGYACSGYVPVEPSTTYVRNCNGVAVGNIVSYFTNDKTLINLAEPGTGVPFTTPSNCAFVGFNFNMENYDMNSYALNTTPNIPFEPYGIKIPILSGGTTTPVYLGEVQTTRRIKKLVLDGTEGWELNAGSASAIPYFRLSNTVTDGITGEVVCTHYVSPDSNISINNTVRGARVQDSTNYGRILIIRTPTNETDTLTAFKAFLAAQYANGTPVTIWYVLAEPTTAIVNEPIRKIGDYADTVSGITVPTMAGANTLSIGTALQPSEVSVNYHGWHPVADVHERESGQWD